MSKSTQSLWMKTAARQGMKLITDIRCDVCIIGAGIAGLSTAYELINRGRSVIVLEAQDSIGGGETGSTSAHLTSILDDRFAHLEAVRGLEAARNAYLSHAAAIDRIEEIQQCEKIECEFQRVNGYLFAAGEDGRQILQDEAKTCQDVRIRFDWVERLPWDHGHSGPVLMFPDQARFHPRHYLNGLAVASMKSGVEIYTGCRVDRVVGGDYPRAVTESGQTIRAKEIVLATNTPINSGLIINGKIASYSSYVIAAEIPAEDAPQELYWDTAEPYHYVRSETMRLDGDDRTLLLVGGEDHRTGQEPQPQERYERLELWARERFPRLGPVTHRWDGQVFETLDGLALIGPDTASGEHVWLATGDSGMGLTHGTLAGMLLCDAIEGRINDWAALYNPSRFPVNTIGRWVSENANSARQYFDWLTGGDDGDPARLAVGEGMVVRKGLKKLAIYRGQEDGELTVLSATCPHAGGIVHWNQADQTWDCPCHGSRFTAEGEVFHGPATCHLQPVEPVRRVRGELATA